MRKRYYVETKKFLDIYSERLTGHGDGELLWARQPGGGPARWTRRAAGVSTSQAFHPAARCPLPAAAARAPTDLRLLLVAWPAHLQ